MRQLVGASVPTTRRKLLFWPRAQKSGSHPCEWKGAAVGGPNADGALGEPAPQYPRAQEQASSRGGRRSPEVAAPESRT